MMKIIQFTQTHVYIHVCTKMVLFTWCTLYAYAHIGMSKVTNFENKKCFCLNTLPLVCSVGWPRV